MYVVVNGIKKYNKITLYRNSILVLGVYDTISRWKTCMYEGCI